MGDKERLLALFDAGELLRPSADTPNLVDLARALAGLAGASDPPLTPAARAMREAIGPAGHYVFVMIDGLGLNLVKSRPDASFLSSHVAMTLQSVFPSSTAPALTSLATGLWPGEHAVTAWWTYLPDRDLMTTILPFVERFTERPLGDLGVSIKEAFPCRSLRGSFAYDVAAVMPARIAYSAYTRYLGADGASTAYQTFSDGVDVCLERIERATTPTFLYLYYPGVDAAEHDHGPDAAPVRKQVALVEREVARLAASLAGRARLVLTADHGQIRVPDDHKLVLDGDDPLLAHLRCPPSGEPRVPFFHCLPGAADAFARDFRARLGDRFLLLSIEEVEALRLFAPGHLSPQARARIGDFVAIGLEDHALMYVPEGRALSDMDGFHGGLTPAEMLVPLVVA